MKKLIFILFAFMAISTATAQPTSNFKTIKITKLATGLDTDDVLVIGADKFVKKVAKSSLVPVNTPKYKVYTAILTLDWNGAHGVVTNINVLENTLGFVPSIQKDVDTSYQGVYSILSSEGFPTNKTFVDFSIDMGLMEWVTVSYQINYPSKIVFFTKKDNILQYMNYRVQVEIRVYN